VDVGVGIWAEVVVVRRRRKSVVVMVSGVAVLRLGLVGRFGDRRRCRRRGRGWGSMVGGGDGVFLIVW